LEEQVRLACGAVQALCAERQTSAAINRSGSAAQEFQAIAGCESPDFEILTVLTRGKYSTSIRKFCELPQQGRQLLR
jgi:hypothetical protein